MIIELTDEELIKLGELTDVEIKDHSDAEFAISVILENL